MLLGKALKKKLGVSIQVVADCCSPLVRRQRGTREHWKARKRESEKGLRGDHRRQRVTVLSEERRGQERKGEAEEEALTGDDEERRESGKNLRSRIHLQAAHVDLVKLEPGQAHSTHVFGGFHVFLRRTEENNFRSGEIFRKSLLRTHSERILVRTLGHLYKCHERYATPRATHTRVPHPRRQRCVVQAS